MQPEAESIFRADKGPSPVAQGMLNLLLGLILLVPFVYVAAQNRLLPALDTIRDSQYDINVIADESTYVGMDNYDRLLSDEVFSGALAYSLTLVVGRVLVVAFVPPIVGVLVGAQGIAGRTLARLILAVGGAAASPIVLAILWSVFWGPLWGREPSPIFPPPDSLSLSSPTGAVNSTFWLDAALITLGIAVGVGVAAYMAVMRGRRAGSSVGSAFLGVWFVSVVVAGASAFQAFIAPFTLTAGGPLRSTTNAVLYLYDVNFKFFQIGYGAAVSSLLIYGSVVVAFLVWFFITRYNLRLRFVAAPGSAGGGCGSILGIPLLALVSVPALALIVWGQGLVTASGAESSIADLGIDLNGAIRNGIDTPLRTIWLMQIPITYLAGLSLGFFRPLGRRLSSLGFLALLVIAFIPVEALTMTWFLQAREQGLVNTLEILGQPWIVSGAALIVFKLFFDGARASFDEAIADGQTREAALLRTVLLPSLPVAALVGVVLSVASAHSLWWPLIVTRERGQFSVPLHLLSMRGTFSADSAALVAVAVTFVIRLGVIAAPVFAILLAALDPLAILGGRRKTPPKRVPTDSGAMVVRDEIITAEFGAGLADQLEGDSGGDVIQR